MKRRLDAERPRSAVFHAITHVWGRPYLDLFLDVCIPNQLAPGNVPALPPGSRYRILTRSLHVSELDAHPTINALRDRIPVDLVVVEALERGTEAAGSYDLMNACHKRAIDDALDADAAIIMLGADLVLSNNALAAVVRRHREGYRMVAVTGLRLSKESFLRDLQQSPVPLNAMCSRELVRLGLRHLHRYTKSMFATEALFCRKPVAVYWPIGDEGLIARCLSLHPLMIDPMRAVTLTEGTNDGPYMAQACPDLARVHVVTDSDELQMFELSSMKNDARRGAGAMVWRVAAMAAMCDAQQLAIWQRSDICLHASDMNDRWQAAAAEAQEFADRVVRRRGYARFVLRWIRRAERIRKRPGEYLNVWTSKRHYVRAKRLARMAERPAKLWKRCRASVARKQVLRPLRLATHRSAKAFRKSTRRIFRQMAMR